MATKYIWECRRCRLAFKLSNGKPSLEADMVVSYHPDQYGNKFYGFKKYSEDLNVEVVRGHSISVLLQIICRIIFVRLATLFCK